LKKSANWVEKIRQELDKEESSLTGKTLVEILDRERVLIEHHAGVSGYSRDCICVRTDRGQTRVRGQCLEIARMSKEQLVIRGRISGVDFCGREG